MSKDYIFEPRPIFSSYTPNLLLGSYYIEDGFQADPTMWNDGLEDAFVNNAGMKVGKDDNENFYLNDFSAEAVLMGTKKLDALEVIPQSPSWKWANYDNELQIPKDIADDDFESAAYERFMEAAVGYNSDDPYFLSVVNSFMDDGEDVDLWAEEADWNRIQTTVLWWKLYDQWMENEGIDFLTGYAEENYDWAVTHSYELGNIGYEMPEPDDDDYYWSMRQAESRHWSYDKPMTERQRYRIRKLGGRIDKSMNRSDASRYIKSLMVNPLHAESFAAGHSNHWMTFGRVDYNWATDPDDVELTDEDFWKIDEHVRNEVRYEIDTNNLPGESNVHSWTLSLTPDEEDEDEDDGFTIYYYWGPAETTGVNSAETFEAPYTGAGALMGISGDSDLSSFTSKELTESSAIHGDFDQASLNYSGHQNLEVRAEAVWDDEDYYDHEAAWERIFEVWMEEWVTGGATSRDILKIYAAKNGFWDYEEVDVTTATAWYDGLTIADREDEIIGADPFNLVGLSSADPAELKKKVALFEALKEIIEDQMDSWDDQFQ
jgi:hypothetical protein